jgi:hypothetical protein
MIDMILKGLLNAMRGRTMASKCYLGVKTLDEVPVKRRRYMRNNAWWER